MSKFVIQPHFRLQEWVAEEKGYFAAEGLDYVFNEEVQSSDAAGLRNANSLSLYVMMTCINAYFTYPGRLSLAEALLTRTDGGAVATIGSSSLTNAAVQPLHNQAFYKALFGNPGITVGQALDQSRSATSDLDLRKSQMLFGDPTMHIHY